MNLTCVTVGFHIKYKADKNFREEYTMAENFERNFDNAAAEYEKSRPNYVSGIYDDIFRYKRISPDSRVLEIGMGTGIARKPVLDTECRFTGIEPGGHLIALAREKFQGCGNFTSYCQTLQDFECPDETFDLIYAATAFHWIPEEYGYRRVCSLLKNGGAFARFAYHAGPDKGRSALTDEIQKLYCRYMHQEDPPAEYSDQNAKELADRMTAYGFRDTAYKLYHTTKDFTADEYMALLRTYPDHMKLDPEDRKQLFSGIYHAIERNGGTMTVYYTMDLELARKID